MGKGPVWGKGRRGKEAIEAGEGVWPRSRPGPGQCLENKTSGRSCASSVSGRSYFPFKQALGGVGVSPNKLFVFDRRVSP